MSATGAMSKALSELMQRHGQTLATPALVPLFEPTPDTDVAVRLLPQRSMSTLSA